MLCDINNPDRYKIMGTPSQVTMSPYSKMAMQAATSPTIRAELRRSPTISLPHKVTKKYRAPIHPTSWKRNSANFAYRGFSEVRIAPSRWVETVPEHDMLSKAYSEVGSAKLGGAPVPDRGLAHYPPR